MNKKITDLVVTFFGVGKSPICPGTFGSIATLPLWFLLISIISYLELKRPILILSIFIIILYIVGYKYTKKYITENNLEDPKEVVIDEVVGQLISFFISLSFVFFLKNKTPANVNQKCPYFLNIYLLITPIIFFRLYDIKKPWIIGEIDSKMKNACGIMLDDIVAGIFAGITNTLITLILIKIFF